MNREYNWPISPVLLGTLLGFASLTILLPGGYDGRLYYLRPWFPDTTTPVWVHWLTTPLTWLPWPYAWTGLAVLTLLAVRFACGVWGTRWTIALFSMPFFWNIWLGQIEIIAVLGAVLGWLVVQKRLHPIWLGVSFVALLTKVQVGWILALVYAWWVYREQGWKPMVWAGGIAIIIGIASLIFRPDWIPLWLDRLERLSPQSRYFNSAIFPYGLLFIPLAFIPRPMDKKRRVRMIVAATLLGSPYFANYHCTTLMTMENRPIILLITWLTFIPMLLSNNQTWAWIIPVAVIFLDILWSFRGTSCLKVV